MNFTMQEKGRIAAWIRWQKAEDQLPDFLKSIPESELPAKIQNRLKELRNAEFTPAESNSMAETVVPESNTTEIKNLKSQQENIKKQPEAESESEYLTVEIPPDLEPLPTGDLLADLDDSYASGQAPVNEPIAVRQSSIDAVVSAVDVIVSAATDKALAKAERTLWNDAVHATMEDFGISRIPGLILLVFASASTYISRSSKWLKIWQKSNKAVPASTFQESLASTPSPDTEKPSRSDAPSLGQL